MDYTNDCESPCNIDDERTQDFVLLIISSTDKQVIAQFEEKYYSDHASRCVLAKTVDLNPSFVEALPFEAEVRRFGGCKSTDELDSWISDVMNTPNRKIFNVSNWDHFAYISAGNVETYLPDFESCGTTAPNSPCDPTAAAASASSSVSSSVTSTPEKKKKKPHKRHSEQEEDDDGWMSSVAPSETSSVVSQLRKKVSKLNLT